MYCSQVFFLNLEFREKFAFFLLEFHQTISDLSITVTMTQIYDNFTIYYLGKLKRMILGSTLFIQA